MTVSELRASIVIADVVSTFHIRRHSIPLVLISTIRSEDRLLGGL